MGQPAVSLNRRFAQQRVDALIVIKIGCRLSCQIPDQCDFDTFAHLRFNLLPRQWSACLDYCVPSDWFGSGGSEDSRPAVSLLQPFGFRPRTSATGRPPPVVTGSSPDVQFGVDFLAANFVKRAAGGDPKARVCARAASRHRCCPDAAGAACHAFACDPDARAGGLGHGRRHYSRWPRPAHEQTVLMARRLRTENGAPRAWAEERAPGHLPLLHICARPAANIRNRPTANRLASESESIHCGTDRLPNRNARGLEIV